MKKNSINIIKKIIVSFLCLGIIGGIVSIGVTINNRLKDDNKVINLYFKIGDLDEHGEYIETDQCLFTPDLIECHNLETNLIFDNNISYKIYYYDKNEEFISYSSLNESNEKPFDFLIPYCRLVIVPEWDLSNDLEDNKITIFNKNKFIKQLEVKVAKNQNLYEEKQDLKLFEFATDDEKIKYGIFDYYLDGESSFDSIVLSFNDDWFDDDYSNLLLFNNEEQINFDKKTKKNNKIILEYDYLIENEINCIEFTCTYHTMPNVKFVNYSA